MISAISSINISNPAYAVSKVDAVTRSNGDSNNAGTSSASSASSDAGSVTLSSEVLSAVQGNAADAVVSQTTTQKAAQAYSEAQLIG